MELFKKNNTKIKLPLDQAQVEYYPNFFNAKKSAAYFNALLENTPWRADDIKVFGKVYPQPRLTALYGLEGRPYTYSGIRMEPLSYTPELLAIKHKVETVVNTEFTTVLLNLYRDGSDSNGWHSDNEPELGTNPVIASVSFGATRSFRFRAKNNRKNTYKIDLESGSLLLMQGVTQHHWQHQIPKTKKLVGPRINLTFRVLH